MVGGSLNWFCTQRPLSTSAVAPTAQATSRKTPAASITVVNSGERLGFSELFGFWLLEALRSRIFWLTSGRSASWRRRSATRAARSRGRSVRFIIGRPSSGGQRFHSRQNGELTARENTFCAAQSILTEGRHGNAPVRADRVLCNEPRRLLDSLHLRDMSAPVTDSSRSALTEHIRERAHALGFDVVRVTSAEPFPETERVLHERIGAGLMGGLDWFTAERASVSANPRALLPTARSLLALGTFYLTDAPRDETAPGDPHGRVSCYAWGDDYHEVIRRRLDAWRERYARWRHRGWRKASSSWILAGWWIAPSRSDRAWAGTARTRAF